PYRSFTPDETPNVLMMVLRHTTGGPLELVAVDRTNRRLVTLSRQAYVDFTPSYLLGCDVPGLLAPGSRFIYFAETTATPGQIDLFLVPADFHEDPRRVGTTVDDYR